MKNFDYALYESVCVPTPEPTKEQEWLEMCDKCNQEYLLCKPALSPRFTEWYESGGFHDSILKEITTTQNLKGDRTITIHLQKHGQNREFVLRYLGVEGFSIRRNSAAFNFRYEECLYDEFYRLDEKGSKIAHDFFTSGETFFHIEFKKMTCVVRKLK